MTTAVMHERPEQTCQECMALMAENGVRRPPVMVNGNLIGLILIGELFEHIISEQKFVIASNPRAGRRYKLIVDCPSTDLRTGRPATDLAMQIHLTKVGDLLTDRWLALRAEVEAAGQVHREATGAAANELSASWP